MAQLLMIQRKFYSNYINKVSKYNNKRCSKLLLMVTPWVKFLEGPDSIDRDLIERKGYKFEHKETTGFERIQKIFTHDNNGVPSPELVLICQGGFTSLLIGVIMGGTSESLQAYIDFIKNNTATKFDSTFHAKKKLQDRVLMAFVRGGSNYGAKLGIFTASILLFTSIISAYRGKSAVLEYILAGGITGALYKLKDGPKPMVVGAGLGCALGTIAGGLTVGITKLSGYTLDDIKQQQYESMQAFRESELEANRKARPDYVDDDDTSDDKFSIKQINDQIEKYVHDTQINSLMKDTNPSDFTVIKKDNVP